MLFHDLWGFGKCLSSNLKNDFATLILTVWENGELNHMMFRVLFLLLYWWISSEYLRLLLLLLLCKTFSYTGFTMLKTCSFTEFSNNLLLMELASCLIIRGRCLEDVLMYNKLLLGFLYGVYKPVIKLDVTPRNPKVRPLWAFLYWSFSFYLFPEYSCSLELLICSHGKNLYSFCQWCFPVLIK